MGQLDLHVVASLNLQVLNKLDILDPPSSFRPIGSWSLVVHFAHSKEVVRDHSGSSFHGIVRVEQSVECQGLGCVPGLNLPRICRQNPITCRESRLQATG